MSDALIYRFGRFEIDLHRRELRFGSEVVPLQPRVFELLRYFAANPVRAVSREELFARVWPGASVADGSLTRAVRALRAGLCRDPALSDAVQTVRGFGYRFCAPIEVLDPRGRPSAGRDERERRLVGRAVELARIADCADEVRQGPRRLVLIVGDAGTGKTALARHALDTAAGDFLVGEGQSIEGFGEQSPYLPIVEAIASFARDELDPQRDRVRAIVRRAAPSWIAHLPALFPGEDEQPRAIDLQPAQMARELLDAIELIASERPTALFIEDVHWADQSTLSLLDSLARRRSPARLLTICTVRTSEIDRHATLRALRADVPRITGALEIETTPIDIDGVREYAAWSLRRGGIEPGSIDRFVAWLFERTGGHPLFFAQLIDHLATLGMLAGAPDDSFSARQLDEAGIPATLGQLIRRWVERFGAEDRAFLEAASIAGFHFDLRAICAALGIEETEAEASCDRLCEAGWIQFRDFETWRDGTRGARLRFEHVLFREALYEDVPPSRRARLHHAIARRIEAGHAGEPAWSSELAAHYEQAGCFEEAARHRVAAAAFAASSQSADEALHHADRGLRGLAHLPVGERAMAEIDLHMSIGMGQAAGAGFSDDRAMAAFERARELARAGGDVVREVAAIWGVASCLTMRGAIESAREAGVRLVALAESTGEPRYVLLALDLLCSIAFFQGRFEDCLTLRHRVEAAIRSAPGDSNQARSNEDVRVTTQLYGALSEWHRGHAPTALDWTREALTRSERLGHPYTTVFAESFASILSFLIADAAGQQRHASRARAVGEKSGISLWREIARFMELCAGPPTADRLPALRATLQAMARYGGLGGTFFIGVLADFELAAGNVEAARRLCAVGIEQAERTTESHNLPMLYATAALVAPDPVEREAWYEKAAASADRIGSIAFQQRVAALRSGAPGSADVDRERLPSAHRRGR